MSTSNIILICSFFSLSIYLSLTLNDSSIYVLLRLTVKLYCIKRHAVVPFAYNWGYPFILLLNTAVHKLRSHCIFLPVYLL